MKFAIAIGDKIGDFSYDYLNDCVKDLYKLPYADFLEAEVYQKYDDGDEPMLIPEEHILSLADYLKLTPPTADSFKTKDDEVVDLMFEDDNQKSNSTIVLGSGQGGFNKFKEYADKLGIETAEELQNYLKNKPINQTIEEFLKTEVSRHSSVSDSLEDVGIKIENSLRSAFSRYFTKIDSVITTAALIRKRFIDSGVIRHKLTDVPANHWGLEVKLTSEQYSKDLNIYLAQVLEALADILNERDFSLSFICIVSRVEDKEQVLFANTLLSSAEKNEAIDGLLTRAYSLYTKD